MLGTVRAPRPLAFRNVIPNLLLEPVLEIRKRKSLGNKVAFINDGNTNSQ